MSKTMNDDVLCAAKFLPCELLDARPSALDYVIQDITHELTDSIMCELEKGELICSLQNVEQSQIPALNSVKIRRKVTLKRLVRCKDCKYNIGEKVWLDGDVTIICDNGMGYPPSDWFCGDGKMRDEQ